MSVALRSSSTGTASTGNCTVAPPSGVTDGDFLLAIAYGDDALVLLTAPSGWTALTPTQSVTGVGTCQCFTKTAAAFGSEVWTGTTNQTKIVHVLACTGASGIDDGPTFASSTTASTTRTAAAANPTGTDSLLVVSFMSLANNSGADAYSTPTGMTELFDGGDATSPYDSSALDYQVLSASGSTGTRVSTTTRSSKWLATSITVKSAAATARPPRPIQLPSGLVAVRRSFNY